MKENINDIYSSFHLLYKLTKCFGVLNFSYDKIQKIYTIKLKDTFLNIVIICSIITLQVTLAFHCHLKLVNDLSLEILTNLENTLFLIIILLQFNLNKCKILQIFKKIQIFDSQVKYTVTNITNRSFSYYLIFNGVVLLLYCVQDVIYSFTTEKTLPFKCLAYFYVPYICVASLRLIFVFFLTQLENRYIYLKCITHISGRLFTQNFIELGKIYRLINEVYNLPLALFFFKLFATLTISLYKMLLNPLQGKYTFLRFFSYNVATSMWFIVAFIEAYTIVYFIEKLDNEVCI